MNSTTTEVQVDREALLGRIRAWEREIDELIAENGQAVLKAKTDEDKKLVAHFENQFTIQKNALDKIKHNVKLTGGSADSARELDELQGYFDRLHSDFVAFSEAL